MPQLTPPVVASGALSSRAQPRLSVDELVLRPWRADDVPALVEAYADPAIQRWHVRSMTPAEAAQYIEAANAAWAQEAAANWAVTEADVVVGRASLHTIDKNDGLSTVAYWVTPHGRGRGVAPRAMTAISDWAFRDLGLHRLELEHSTLNDASCRVADKAGYALEGTRRSQARHADGWHDMHVHVLLNGG